MARSRATIEKELMDKARSVAPLDPALGRTSLKPQEVLALSRVAESFHRRELSGPAADRPAAERPAPAGRATTIPATAAPAGPEPRWLDVARGLLGTREIPGPTHSGFIAKGWARLGAPWFNDDETPWCGFFVAHCIDAAGFPYPRRGLFARARAWLDWGEACDPVMGAVVVFGRAGGGHVGFLVGQSATHLYVLGGNQSNAVTIAPIAKTRALGFRWPAGLPHGTVELTAMSGGAISTNEA